MSFRDKRNRHRHRGNRERDKDSVPMGVKVIYTGDSQEQRTKDLEKALSKFKKIITKEGLMLELRDRQYFKSRSRKRYEKRRSALYRFKTDRDKEDKKRLKGLHKKRGRNNKDGDK